MTKKTTDLGRAAAPDTRFMTPKQIARVLQVSPRSIHRWMRLAGLPYNRVGNKLRFDLDEVRAWAQNRRRNATR